MVDTCTCNSGCSSKRQLYTYPKYCFPKRLFVAISLAIIITMCVIPAESRSVVQRRKHRNASAPQSHNMKDVESIALDHRLRHHHRRMSENLTQQKKRPKFTYNEKFHFANKKITKRLKNTKRFLNEDKNHLDKLALRELKGLTYTIPNWVPRVNFLKIHYFDFKHLSRNTSKTVPELRFNFIMPKLYKSLLEYQKLFESLINVKTNFPDEAIKENSYRVKRHQAIGRTLEKLRQTIEDVKYYCNCSDQVFVKKKLDLSTLEQEVNMNQCKKNDYIAFKAYYNFLNNWLHELQCRGKSIKREYCKRYVERLTPRKQDLRNQLL